MKTSLDHLPQDKREQLNQVVQVIIDSVQPEKIILFGSYARGKWVEDQHMEGHILHEYVSDYDILVVTRRGDERVEHDVQEMVEARCNFYTPVTIIVHSIDYVNARLSEGQYFFSDIKKEGILLYDANNIPLAEQRDLSPTDRKNIAQEDFDTWFSTAREFLIDTENALYRKSLKNAAFYLHQAAERTYNAAILVFTGYKPRTHNLGRLIRLCRDFSPEMATVFPNNTKEETHLFNLLKKAYIDARYKKDYAITEEELSVLIDRIKQLQAITERICGEKIASLGAVE
ncbi:MAG: HEPN domain-containing protein [Chitinophaga sp.]|uniref:HEPN domain-containing protein n=1 Tax=Chitinophaga sp. TaxID=1869181 RepID=UPI001AFDF009|nr:HEPN domain-containing protein [Chitinophaga sp.]MBO9730780.1 HEPN domain-containing protein [Chitinophaga sp.]